MDYGLFGIFTAGIFTFVTPCVLPLIPIYLSALIGSDIRQIKGAKRGQLIARSLFFSVGFISVFTLFGLTASSIGNLLFDYKAHVMVGGAVLVLLFSLKFLGVISIPFFDRIVRMDDTKMQTRFGALNALIMGVVFAAGWSPCVGPVLGSVLTYTASTTSTPVEGALYLSIYGAGFALPLLITAIFAETGISFLKKINPYLPKIEKAIGALLLIVSLAMFSDAFGNMQVNNTQQAVNNLQQTDNTSQSNLPHELMLDEDPVMVEFFSSSCTVCKRMEPIIEAITSQCDGNMVRVKKVDISLAENSHFVRQYKLVGVPTFLFISREGSEVARLVGEQSEKTLKQALSALRGVPCPGLKAIDFSNHNMSFPEQQDDTASCTGNSETNAETINPHNECEPS